VCEVAGEAIDAARAVEQDREVAQVGGRDAGDSAADLVVVGGLLAIGREVDDADVFACDGLSAQIAEAVGGCAQDREALRDEAGVDVSVGVYQGGARQAATVAPSVTASGAPRSTRSTATRRQRFSSSRLASDPAIIYPPSRSLIAAAAGRASGSNDREFALASVGVAEVRTLAAVAPADRPKRERRPSRPLS
jgi:hypothetical protein